MTLFLRIRTRSAILRWSIVRAAVIFLLRVFTLFLVRTVPSFAKANPVESSKKEHKRDIKYSRESSACFINLLRFATSSFARAFPRECPGLWQLFLAVFFFHWMLSVEAASKRSGFRGVSTWHNLFTSPATVAGDHCLRNCAHRSVSNITGWRLARRIAYIRCRPRHQ